MPRQALYRAGSEVSVGGSCYATLQIKILILFITHNHTDSSDYKTMLATINIVCIDRLPFAAQFSKTFCFEKHHLCQPTRINHSLDLCATVRWKKKKKKISHRQLRSVATELIPFHKPLSRRGLTQYSIRPTSAGWPAP